MCNQDEQDNQDQAEKAYREFMQAVNDGDKEALRVVEANAWAFLEACMGRRKELWSIVGGGWRTPTATDAEDKDAKAEKAYREFMQAVNDGDKEALRVIEANAWAFIKAVLGDTQALSAIVGGGWRTPTATEEVAPAPRFPPQSAPRFQTLSELWHEAHPDALKED